LKVTPFKINKDASFFFSKEELDDNAKMEKYRELATFARKEEKSKFYTAIGIWITLCVIFYFLTYFGIID